MKINENFVHLQCNGDEFVFGSKSEAVDKMQELDASPDEVKLSEIEADKGSDKFSVTGVSWKEIASMVMG